MTGVLERCGSEARRIDSQLGRWGLGQATGDFQEQGRCLGRQFDDQGEELGQRVVRRCAGFCAGCWRISRLAARIRWLLDSPWGYQNTCTPRDLRGVQVFLFSVIALDCI